MPGLTRRSLNAADRHIQRAIPFPMTRGGRIAFTVTALVGALSTLLNFFDPGSADSSQVSAVTFIFFVFALGAIAVADGLFREVRQHRTSRTDDTAPWRSPK